MPHRAREPADAPPRGLVARRIDVGGTSVMVLSYPVDAGAVRALAALSDAERDVVDRALAGASNAEIARARGSSPRTVANLLARAYRKLGISSRRELAATMAGVEVSCEPTRSR